MTRRRLLTAEVHTQITQTLRLGAYATDAAAMAGVSPRTHSSWMERGRVYEEHLEAGGDEVAGEQIFLDYMMDCERSRAEARVVAVGAISKAVRDPANYYPGWRAAIEFLRRTDPSNWEQLQAHKVELSGADGGPIQFEVGELEQRLSVSLSESLPRLREISQAGGADEVVDAEIVEDAGSYRRERGVWLAPEVAALTTDDVGNDYLYSPWTAVLGI